MTYVDLYTTEETKTYIITVTFEVEVSAESRWYDDAKTFAEELLSEELSQLKFFFNIHEVEDADGQKPED